MAKHFQHVEPTVTGWDDKKDKPVVKANKKGKPDIKVVELNRSLQGYGPGDSGTLTESLGKRLMDRLIERKKK